MEINLCYGLCCNIMTYEDPQCSGNSTRKFKNRIKILILICAIRKMSKSCIARRTKFLAWQLSEYRVAFFESCPDDSS